LRCYQWRR